nr:BTB/POZ and MATH domain-containing protein 2-like [Aegilops tauschii subsp. strangulata]
MADRCKLSAAIVSDSVERSYLLKVDGYSSAKERFKTGECLASPLLSFKGHDLDQNSSAGETMDDQFVVVPPSNLHLHFADLLESMDGADVTFHVGGQMFSAHRLILAARSPVFRAELLGAMKEKAGGPIEIHDMEADVFKCLLHFIYTDSLPAHLDVMMASHLLVAADRYNIERLKLICEHKLRSHIDANMVATSLVLAEQHCCNGLKEACLQFLASPSNLEAMMASDGYKHLKSSCPSALKELIARLLPPNMKAAKDIVMAL